MLNAWFTTHGKVNDNLYIVLFLQFHQDLYFFIFLEKKNFISVIKIIVKDVVNIIFQFSYKL